MAEVRKLNEEKGDSLEAYRDFMAGKLSYIDYVIDCREQNLRNEKRNTINAVMQMAEYVYERPGERQLLYQRGWEKMFINDNPILISLPAVILYLIIFTADVDSKLVSLQITCVKGRRCLLGSRAVAALILTIAVVSISEAVRYLFYSLKFGLPDPGFSFQSLEMFGEYTGHMSLRGAFLYKILLEILGCFMIGCVVMTVSSFTKNRYASIFISLALVIESYIVFDDNTRGALLLCNCFNFFDLMSRKNHFIYPSVCLLLSLCLIAVTFWRKSEKRVLK